MSFHEIDDFLWEFIKPYFPPQKPHTGRPRADMKKLMNGILYVVMTDCTRKDVPRRMDLSQQFIDFISIYVNMVLTRRFSMNF
ncbi:MAG: transposase [Methanococcaceae archaeon]